MFYRCYLDSVHRMLLLTAGALLLKDVLLTTALLAGVSTGSTLQQLVPYGIKAVPRISCSLRGADSFSHREHLSLWQPSVFPMERRLYGYLPLRDAPYGCKLSVPFAGVP